MKIRESSLPNDGGANGAAGGGPVYDKTRPPVGSDGVDIDHRPSPALEAAAAFAA